VIVDFDDFHATNHRLDLLERLHDANPKFRCTLFAVPGLGTDDFWNTVPDWCELAVHGWLHPHPRECENWSYDEALHHLVTRPARFVAGWKSPGWQISDGTYRALVELGFWCADQPYNDARRPRGLRVHRLGDGDHWHGHIQNVCGNGLEEQWEPLLAAVTAAESFELVSEAARPWVPTFEAVA
jgi:hypothetical protein